MNRFVQEMRDEARAAGSPERQKALTEIADKAAAYLNDQTFYRIVALLLGLAVVIAVSSIFSLLASEHQQGLDGIAAIGSAAVAGLVAVFKRD